MCKGKERMRAASSGVDAGVAVSPFRVVANFAVPEAVICKGRADRAEGAGEKTLSGVLGRSDGSFYDGYCLLVGIRRVSNTGWMRFEVLAADQGVRWILMGVATLEAVPSEIAEAVPVQTAFIQTVTAMTQIILAIFANGAVLMQIVLKVCLPAAVARYRWLWVVGKRASRKTGTR